MTKAINYKKNISKAIPSNYIYFVDENFNILSLKKHILRTEYLFISDLLKSKDSKKQILIFDISSKKKIALVSFKNKISNSEIENLGANFYDISKEFKQSNLVVNTDTISHKFKNFIGYFLHGYRLKSYKFERYKSKKSKKNISIKVIGRNKLTLKDQLKFKALEEGTFYTRDLVSEPGNILHPDEYAKRLKSLKKNGLKVNIYF